MLYLFEYNSRQLRREREKKKREREREKEREREREQEMEKKREEGRTHSYPVARGWAGVPFEVITLSL